MKIVFVTRWVPPLINGIGEYTVHLARELRRQGVETHVLASEGERAGEKWIHAVLESWKPSEILKAARSFSPDWVSFQYVPQLYNRWGLCWGLSGLPAFLKENMAARISVTFHEFQSGWRPDLKRIFLAAASRLQTLRLLRGCDIALTTCAAYGEILKSYPGAPKVSVIPVGATVMPLADENRKKLLDRYGIHGGKVFAVFGRLSNFRNTRAAVKALAQARAKNIPAFLFLIGSLRSSNPAGFADMIETVKALGMEKFVVETGELSAEDVSRHLAASDVFLFPQLDGVSTRSTTIMSAMAHGLPVIGYKPAPGNFDGHHLPYGFLAEQGNEEGFLTAAVQFIGQDTDLNKKESSRLYFDENFSWARMARQYRAVLEGGAGR